MVSRARSVSRVLALVAVAFATSILCLVPARPAAAASTSPSPGPSQSASATPSPSGTPSASPSSSSSSSASPASSASAGPSPGTSQSASPGTSPSASASLSPSPSPHEKLILRVGWSPKPDSLNPFVGTEQSSYELYHVCYDFLTDYGDQYLETRPGLAENWMKSSNGLTWYFKIRSGVKWSDGKKLTAKDIAFTYNWELQLQLKPFLSALDGIKYAYAPDDTTLVIQCSRPKADILSMWCPILPQHVWSKYFTAAAAMAKLNKPPVVGSGPFRIVEWHKGRRVRCVANKHYWGGVPNVDEVDFLAYANRHELANDVKTGALDIGINIPQDEVRPLAATPGTASYACKQKAFDYLSFNCYSGPSLGDPVLRDPAFRRALNWGIDKRKMVQLAYDGYADPGTSLFEVGFYDPELDWHWQPPVDMEYRFDPERAKRLLAAAGYKDTDGDGILNDPHNGKKDITLRLWARKQSQPSQVMGQLIAGWWRDLGIDVKYAVKSEDVLRRASHHYVRGVFKPNYDAYIWEWQPSGSDPGRRLGYFRTEQIQAQNDCCWSSRRYDKLWKKQSEELDRDKRKDIVYEMEQLFYRSSPYIVLDYPRLLEAWNTSRWEGWRRIPEPDGAVAYITDDVSNYFRIAPRAAVTEPSAGVSVETLVGLGVAAAVVLAVVVFLLWRRARTRDEFWTAATSARAREAEAPEDDAPEAGAPEDDGAEEADAPEDDGAEEAGEAVQEAGDATASAEPAPKA